jgi:hypothetical protein
MGAPEVTKFLTSLAVGVRRGCTITQISLSSGRILVRPTRRYG